MLRVRRDEVHGYEYVQQHEDEEWNEEEDDDDEDEVELLPQCVDEGLAGGLDGVVRVFDGGHHGRRQDEGDHPRDQARQRGHALGPHHAGLQRFMLSKEDDLNDVTLHLPVTADRWRNTSPP